MKKLFITTAFVCSAAISSNLYAQQAPPPGAGDKDLGDKNIKMRSVEMERTKRDANKTGKPATENPAAVVSATATEDALAAKYDEIKTDYEQIQLSQDVIIKAYQGTGKIDYVQIGKSALEINKSAMRLNFNLFPVPPIENTAAKKDTKEEETEKEKKKPKSVRDLIVELDNRIGSFATSPMFQNLRTVDTAVSEKARLDLAQIIELSRLLTAEAEKMSKT